MKPKWKLIGTAPIDAKRGKKSILLGERNGIIYCGRRRYGNRGEPQQDELVWRCDSSGKFGNPTHWMPLPPKPTLDDYET